MSKRDLDSVFWDYMYRLDSIFAEAGNDTDKLATVLQDNRGGLWDFVWRYLGVYGGAFGLAHQSREEFFLLQHTQYPPPIAGIPIINIPYLAFDSEDDRNLIALLFIGRRERQFLRNNPPEFYYHLPQNRPSSSGSNLSLSLIFGGKLGRQDGFKFLYCPVGEVSLVLYGWRWLIRSAQMNGVTCRVDPGQAITVKPQVQDLWTPGLWPKSEHSIELDWINTVASAHDELQKLSGFLDTDRKVDPEMAFLSGALRAWERIKQRVDFQPEQEAYDFSREWRTLGLVDNRGRTTEVLRELLWFAYHVVTKISDRYSGRGTRKRNTVSKVIIKAKKMVEKITRSFRVGVLLAPDKRLEFDKLLRQIIYYFLLSENNNDVNDLTALNLLNRLHKVARFPVIPYFYLTSLDRQPKEHLVFPILESRQFPVRVKDLDSPSPCVVFCLLTLNPIWRLPAISSFTRKATHEPYHPGETKSEAIRRLSRIYTFFVELGRPIIDKGFYGKRVQTATLEEQLGAFSHEVGKLTKSIFYKSLLRLSFLFSINDNTEAADRFGKLFVDSGDKANELARWLVCPEPKFLENLTDLLFIWGGDKNLAAMVGFREDANFGEIAYACGLKAREIVAVQRVLWEKNVTSHLFGPSFRVVNPT